MGKASRSPALRAVPLRGVALQAPHRCAPLRANNAETLYYWVIKE